MRKGNLFALVLVWFVMVAWRPFVFGFFSDDWILLTGSRLSPNSLAEHLRVHASRPFYGLLVWASNLVLHGGLRSWTIMSSLIVLVAVICVCYYLYLVLTRLGIENESSAKASLFGATLWLVSPFCVVAASWPTCTLTLVALCLFSFGTMLIFHPRLQRQLLGAAALSASFLTYEAYILAFPVTLLAITAASATEKRSLLRRLELFLGAFLFTVFYKECARVSGFGLIHKSFTSTWPLLFTSNITGAGRLLEQAFSPLTSLVYLCGILYLVAVAALSWADKPLALFLVLAVAAGYLTSALLHALVGYSFFAGTGVMARTMMGPLFYMTFGLAGLFALGHRNAHRKPLVSGVRRAFLYGSALSLLISLASANVVRSQEWLALWKRELTVLQAIPSRLIEKSVTEGENPVIVIVQIADDDEGRIFGASWELSPAVALYYPQFSEAIGRRRLMFLPAREGWFETRWNESRIEQRKRRDPAVVVESFQAAQAYYLLIPKNGVASLSYFNSGKADQIN